MPPFFMVNMLVINEISKIYDDINVLSQADLALTSGQAHGLLGANGAGKSTLIKIMMGLVFADAGTVTPLASIALLPENPYLPLNLTAFQAVTHACRMQRQQNHVKLLLQQVRLKKEAWHKPIRSYSKGMKQRTSIAYALAGQPEWLILDEPMSGLDAMGRKQMLTLFASYHAAGTSLLMCSHSVTDLVRMCDHVHIMAKGKVCESVHIQAHSMQEAEQLEERLMFWTDEHALD